MWSNLHNYIDVCIKYIFLFKNKPGLANEEFLIAENPADLQMPGLWETREYIEEIQSLPYEFQSCATIGREWPRNLFFFDRAHYHGHIAGIKRLIYQKHRDVIEKNSDIQFKVIKVPMTYSLYHKIMKLPLKYQIKFANSEICTILKYYTRFDEPIMIQLVKFICEYLLNNKQLLKEIQVYKDYPNGDQCMSLIMKLLIPIFGTKETTTQFKKIVRSHIMFVLIEENGFMIELSGQSLSNSNYILNMNHDGFALAFLFDKVEIEYGWLVDNEDALDTIFNNNRISSPYTVIINDGRKIFDNFKEMGTLKRILNIISTSKFLTGESVNRLILKFENFHANIDMSCLTNMNASVTASCAHCSLEFIKSLSECAKIEADIDKYLIIKYLDGNPRNLTRISCDRIECDNDVKIPDSVEIVDVKTCILASNKTLTLGKNCKSVEIVNMRGKLIISGFMECDMGPGMMCGTLYFDFNTNETIEKRSLRLYRAKIYTKVKIRKDIEKIDFNDVTVTSESIVVLNDKCQSLKITNSEGRFDLRPYIGIAQFFDRNMIIEISTIKRPLYDFFGIIFNGWCFTHTIKLPNIYESVKLMHVSMTKNTEIILNRACKKLIVHNCEIAINFQEMEYLENLDIRLSIDRENNIRLINLRRVNHIRFSDVCWNINLITTIITSIKNIRHVEFNDGAILMSTLFSDLYYNRLMAFITSKGFFENNSDSLSKILAIKDSEPSVFVFEMLNIMTNCILRNVLDKEVMNTVSTLELESIAIDSDNSRSLRKLKGLKILQIRSKNITNEFLYNLPPNLELLDITDLFVKKINRTEKYVIKPSVIIRPYKRLKVLVVDVEFLYNVCSLSVLMPSLEVIEVQYSPTIKINLLVQIKKIKVSELFIQCGNFKREHRHVFVLKECEMLWFLGKLKFYIEFESLKCITFVLFNNRILFDPKTLKVVK
ncbi:putative LRR containing protein [Trachipleistophora hominis]|uniref:Putative LRR containing protein n=1 Tax=Trachipleistophora hominis TaxID=72359 RepID=L7JTE8_TRAHO|nr:putative LRR containing protein [Trachipleistophora hominis]